MGWNIIQNKLDILRWMRGINERYIHDKYTYWVCGGSHGEVRPHLDVRWHHLNQLKTEYIYKESSLFNCERPCTCDGDRIVFGTGPEAACLGQDPTGCYSVTSSNVQLASASEDKWCCRNNRPDNRGWRWLGFPYVYIASPAFCDVLTAKLLVSGRLLV